MRSHHTRNGAPGQLILFPGVEPAAAGGARGGGARRRPTTAVARKAERLEQMARAAEREMAESYRAGDMPVPGAGRRRARGARRAPGAPATVR